MANPTNAANIVAQFTSGYETFAASPYYDVNGYAIGYGNHYYQDGTAVQATDPDISQADAWALMVYYLSISADAANSQLTAPISDQQLGALADIGYRCGSVPKVLINLINSGATTEAVAVQIGNTCTTVGGVENDAEQARATAEAALYTAGASGGSSGAPDTDTMLMIGGGVLLLVLLFADEK